MFTIYIILYSYACQASADTPTLACTDNAWVAPAGNECPEPVTECAGEPPALDFSSNDYSTVSPKKTVGAFVNYACWNTDDTDFSTCQGDGTWSDLLISCPEFPANCAEEDIPFQDYASLTSSGPYGSGSGTAVWTCDVGGTVEYECQTDGTWGPIPTAGTICSAPITHCDGAFPEFDDSFSDYNNMNQVDATFWIECNHYSDFSFSVAAIEVKCDSDGNWDYNPTFTCPPIEAAACTGPPPFVEYATAVLDAYENWGKWLADTEVTYTCDADAGMTETSTCTNGEWTAVTLVCSEPITHCSFTAPTVDNSLSHYQGDNTVDASFRHVCNFLAPDESEIVFTSTCNADGTWSTDPDPLVESCPTHATYCSEQVPHVADATLDAGDNVFETTRIHTCSFDGAPVESTCQDTGVWTAPTGGPCLLAPNTCGATIPVIANSVNDFNTDHPDARIGATITYSCVFNGDSVKTQTVTCDASGDWLPTEFQTDAVDDPCPTHPIKCFKQNPYVAFSDNPDAPDRNFETTVTYTCAFDNSEVTSTCTDTGEWSTPDPCPVVPTNCDAIPTLDNSKNNFNGDNTIGATVKFVCTYDPTIMETLTCEDDVAVTGTWTELTITCPELPIKCSRRNPFVDYTDPSSTHTYEPDQPNASTVSFYFT